jgi:hypothetical protein
MLFIQQSSSFRAWTSRALMLYFRRILIFLVVNPRENINNNLCLLQQNQQQTVYFTDDEDKICTEYIFKNLSQGLNNSMTKSIESDQSSQIYNSIQTPVTEQFEPSSDNSNQGLNSFSIKTINSIETNEDDVSDVSVYQHQQTPVNYHNQIYSHLNSTDSMPSYPVSLIYENKRDYISFYSLVHFAYHHFLYITRLIMIFHILYRINPRVQFNIIYPMMKIIFTKNIKPHFHIFFIKQKVFILFVTKIN